MKKTTCFLLFLWLAGGILQAQTLAPERRSGELIVQIQPGKQVETVLADLNRSTGIPFTVKQTLAADWHMYLLQYPERQDQAADVLQKVRQVRDIVLAQYNSKVQERSLEPNDTEWWRQGDMTFIKAPEMWAATTGGLTPAGDTIVIAVLEKGALMTHPDLAPNRFWNWHDIPDNDVDDDGNGYTDDFGGWNPQTFADDLGTKGYHGTAVNGIIGARGNNQQGISGLNWTVKLLNVAGMDYESEIIQGYQYVGKMRQQYNQTNGAKGAFVVATNASFGFDEEFAEDHPVWCALYDSLGKLGVLSVGATANVNINVDEKGDMPTSCTSEYLITVTNITKAGAKVFQAGYGSNSIDLGAPGSDTYSTFNSGGQNNDIPSYGVIGGCSAAAPHVTGTIGLLYSLDCEPFTSDAISNPTVCARRVRDAILLSVEPNETLNGITTTGGHLNLSNALASVRELCKGAKVGPLEILEVQTSAEGNKFRVFYQTPLFQTYNFRVFNMLGQLMYEQEINPQQFSENYIDFETYYWPAGVYVMSIGRGDVVKSRKFPKI
ncbi:MAG TPA: S8 family peptidase [Saprospiraceae bacterium]|nr:S8 family peptidase [Saprospiraceae bacterium]